MSISKKMINFIEEGGWIRKMFEVGLEMKQKYGEENVYDLSLGNPVLEPPFEFNNVLSEISKKPPAGIHRYMPNAGLKTLREKIAKLLSEEINIDFKFSDIIMTCGAAGGLNVVLKTILNPDDEVIFFRPYFPEYLYYVDNHRGIVKIANTDDKFLPDLEDLESLISEKTKAIIINSPNNPTGVLYSEQILKDIRELLNKKSKLFNSSIFLISDEPYRKIVFDNLEYPHVYHYYKNSIVVYSHSKDLGLPGERIGYITVNENIDYKSALLEGFNVANRILGFVNAPALIQYVLLDMSYPSFDVSYYEKKRDYLYSSLSAMGYTLVRPDGGFYLFPKSPVDEFVFTEDLQKEKVLVVPGKGFGLEGYFRLSYCSEQKVLEGAMNGFYKVAQKYSLV